MAMVSIRARMKKNHHKKLKNFPTGSSSSKPFAEYLRCGTFKSCMVLFFLSAIDTTLVNNCSDSAFFGTIHIESGLGGAGTSGIGKGVTVVIPRKGVGGGVIYTFLGGKGGVTDT